MDHRVSKNICPQSTGMSVGGYKVTAVCLEVYAIQSQFSFLRVYHSKFFDF